MSEWRKLTLPGGARIAVDIRIAFESFTTASQFTTGGRPGKMSVSYGEYGARVGIWRLLDIVNGEGVQTTVDINGLAAQRHPDAIRAMVDGGHELAGHGWQNDVYLGEDPERSDLEIIQRTTEAIERASGGVRPTSWVSPAMVSYDDTKALLAGEGYRAIGDDASDDAPFVEDIDGRPFATVPNVAFNSHDLRHWMRTGSKPDVIRDSFIATFDQLYAEGTAGRPGSVAITLHAHVGGRPTLAQALRDVIAHVKGHEGVWWATMSEQAEWAIEQRWYRS